MSIGLIKYWQVFEEKLWYTQLYHSTFSLVVLIIVVNMFVSLINDTYEHVRTARMYEYDAELLEYAERKIKAVLSSIPIFKNKGMHWNFQPCIFNFKSFLIETQNNFLVPFGQCVGFQ